MSSTNESTNAGGASLLPRQRLLGKVALVTGGASGIGGAIVRLFHKHGAKVCIVDVQDKLGQQLCHSLGGEPNTSCYLHCDVSIEDDIRLAVNFTVDKFGTLDIMVNNAGVIEQINPDIRHFELLGFDRTIRVNARGVFIGMKHAARIMIPLKKGTIISTCSMASAIGGVSPHAYAASKHAVVGLTKNVAAELGKHGIRVNCVSPFALMTPMNVNSLPEEVRNDDGIAALLAFIRQMANLQGVDFTVDDVANAVLFLASDEAKYVSGVNLLIDGGFSSVNHSFSSNL